jgi:hypothetical protein
VTTPSPEVGFQSHQSNGYTDVDRVESIALQTAEAAGLTSQTAELPQTFEPPQTFDPLKTFEPAETTDVVPWGSRATAYEPQREPERRAATPDAHHRELSSGVGEAPPRFDRRLIGVWCTVVTGSLLGLSSVFRNEFNTQDWDPQYMRDVVLRTMRFGGSYYENGIHNKGPLEPVLYHVAALVTGYESYWFAVSVMATISALCVSFAAARAFGVAWENKQLAIAAGFATFVQFTLTGADYAGKLYSRNMTVALLAIASVLIFGGSLWRQKKHPWSITGNRSAAAIGFLLGLSAQTVSTTALSCSVLGLAFVWLTRNTARSTSAVHNTKELRQRFFLSGIITFLSAPLYYSARGIGGLYWKSWWTYGQYMTEATGQPVRRQFARGWHDQWMYYRDRPVMAIAGATFVVVTVALWAQLSRLQQTLHLTVAAWFVASSVEIILTQRNSSHYYSVSAVPAAIICALTAALILKSMATAGAKVKLGTLTPTVATIFAVGLSGSQPFFDGVRSSATFRGTSAKQAERLANRDGNGRTVQAMLDLVSNDGDAMWAWTNEPWPYLIHNRTSATRFIWKSFLMGEIYLGRTSTDYVLPGTWQWFAEDLAESKPVVYYEDLKTQMAMNTPAGAALQAGFRETLVTEKSKIWVRPEFMARLLGGGTGTTWVPSGASVQRPDGGWKTSSGSITYAASGVSKGDDVALLTDGVCQRIDGVLKPQPDGTPGRFVLRFEALPTERPQAPGYFASGRTRLALEGTQAVAGDDGAAFFTTTSNASPTGATPFTIIIGRRSAALMVNGSIRTAVAIPRNARTVVEPRAESVELTDLSTSPLGYCQNP